MREDVTPDGFRAFADVLDQLIGLFPRNGTVILVDDSRQVDPHVEVGALGRRQGRKAGDAGIAQGVRIAALGGAENQWQ